MEINPISFVPFLIYPYYYCNVKLLPIEIFVVEQSSVGNGDGKAGFLVAFIRNNGKRFIVIGYFRFGGIQEHQISSVISLYKLCCQYVQITYLT